MPALTIGMPVVAGAAPARVRRAREAGRDRAGGDPRAVVQQAREPMFEPCGGPFDLVRPGSAGSCGSRLAAIRVFRQFQLFDDRRHDARAPP